MSIPLSQEDVHRLYQHQSQALIARVIGKNVGCSIMIPILKTLWRLTNPISGFDLGEYFFIVKFSDETDFARAMNGGPWFFGPHFISIRRREPGFKLSQASLSTTTVWARLLELPIELYDKQMLTRIGNSLGKLIKLSTLTMGASDAM
ncbi:hypothetical protein Vadar_025014 [Vaccinium darrowii]|uniref:Uncharacterized protein n=1 Tax=Vaccinium darrowii TaxID=229202 RepID=A0ACB7Y1J3_9ERIC|nr:hypothetical protein Vadar_025014 [Vaccinium darrowii]